MKIKKRPAREEIELDMDTLLDPFAGSVSTRRDPHHLISKENE